MHRRQGLGESQECCKENGAYFADVTGNQKADKGLHVGVNCSAFFHRTHDGRKIVVGQNHVGSLLRNRGSRSHGHTDRCLLQGRCIVDPIAGHCGDLAEIVLEHLDESLFVRWLGAAKDDVVLLENLELFLSGFQKELLPLERFERLAAFVVGVKDVDVFCNGDGRVAGVSRDHDDPDPGLGAFLDAVGDLGTSWILDAHQAHQGQTAFDVFVLGRILEQGMIPDVVVVAWLESLE
mmetsp:Transcript_16006/g.32820  ORF Transcript_16006/g.32820 Transcript_16006/m.32820 type:complete len:236 (-) Transcript_16006:651-1358(-)